MKNIYYFLTIFPILWETISLTDNKRVYEFVKSYYTRHKQNPIPPLTSNQKTYATLSLGYILWAYIGLFGSQWIVFIILISLSYMPKKYKVIRYIDALLSILLLIFMILNVYHFKIDLWEWIKNVIV